MKEKKIILTGSTGVIGKNLSLYLKKKRGIKIIFYKGSKKTNFTKSYDQILKYKSVDCLIHLAGKDDYNSTSLKEIKRVNNNLDSEIISIVKKLNIPKLIFSSTNRVYEGSYKSIITEKTKTSSINQYSKSKLNSEKKYSKLKLNLIVLRLPSVLSKHSKKGLIYNFLKKMLSNKRIEVFNPKSLFNNVILQKDLNKIIYFLIMKKFLKKKEIINISAEKPTQLNYLLRFMLSKTSSKSKIIVIKSKKLSKTYSNIYQRKIFDFKINTVIKSIKQYLDELQISTKRSSGNKRKKSY